VVFCRFAASTARLPALVWAAPAVPPCSSKTREISLPKERFGDGFHARVGFLTRGRDSQMLANIHPLKFQQVGRLFGGHV